MRISGGVFLIISILVLTGCWGRSELKDVGIVAAVGIDVKDENKFEATTQVVKPGEVKKNKSGAVLVNSATGFTVFEAVRDLIIKGGKKQIWHHINAYIIGEEAAKTGVRPRIDFLARDHEPRFRMNVFVTKGKAKDLLNMKSNINPIPAAAMQLALEEQESLAKAPKVELHDFIQKLMEPYEDPYLPIIRNGKQNFEIFGTAVFKDDKMVGELNSKETRGMLRVVGEVQGGLQVIQYKPGNDEVPNYSFYRD
ncbi:hypothetical protein PN4B1_47830 [Paenibacillus naphthalenovorans]|uniref:Ger(x)C family spore germination protein n=1 Tax=Paenibacillus naphthalenovorans TaxID=162209 RepID=UPI0010B88C8D|nr:Ger(x)C family spore germination protein [Paenibacillus naphthalenovorans]GCL74801.1 hypothetical protein PN4B1_47830 [Paenibacillus naphthalenovorans]